MRKTKLAARGCYTTEAIIPEDREVADTWRADLSEGDMPAEAPVDFLDILDRLPARRAA